MHRCLIQWHVHKQEHTAHVMHVWPAVAMSDQIWATMASALQSVMGTPAQRAVSVWHMRVKVHQQLELRGMPQTWVTSGVSTYLGLMVRRKARATVYIDRMDPRIEANSSRPPVVDAVYDRRAKDTASAVAYSTSLATLKATWKMMRERKAIAAKLASMDVREPTARHCRRRRV